MTNDVRAQRPWDTLLGERVPTPHWALLGKPSPTGETWSKHHRSRLLLRIRPDTQPEVQKHICRRSPLEMVAHILKMMISGNSRHLPLTSVVLVCPAPHIAQSNTSFLAVDLGESLKLSEIRFITSSGKSEN